MIIVNLIGGLGNQMFQYACGRAMSVRTNQKLLLATDQFAKYKLHNGFELTNFFNVNAKFASFEDIKSLLSWQADPNLRWLIGRHSLRWLANKGWCCEPYSNYWPGIKEFNQSAYLHGYWQSELYFSDIKNTIDADFSWRLNLDDLDRQVSERMRESPSASLHVRCGDYLLKKNKDLYATCDINYYLKAIRLIRKKIPNVRLFVFSDDCNWVQENMSEELGAFELVSHNRGLRSANDMRLMSLADHQIIANSSFSWWGAWLNKNNNKIIIAPRNWYADGRDTTSLVPNSWIKI